MCYEEKLHLFSSWSINFQLQNIFTSIHTYSSYNHVNCTILSHHLLVNAQSLAGQIYKLSVKLCTKITNQAPFLCYDEFGVSPDLLPYAHTFNVIMETTAV